MLEFALRAAMSTPLNFLLAAAGGFAGYMITRFFKWSIHKKWRGGIVTGFVVAAVTAIAVFGSLGMQNSDAYIQSKKASMSDQLRNDPVWRNEALDRTWNIVVSDGNQEGVTPIEDGGTMIKLTSIADAQIYAQEAAQALEDHIRLNQPVILNTELQSKEDVAVTVMASSQNQDFQTASIQNPVELNQDNKIATEVMDLRVAEVFESYTEGVDSQKSKTMQFLIYTITLTILIGSVIVCISAWKELTSITSK
mgnify:CR=1 FL=1